MAVHDGTDSQEGKSAEELAKKMNAAYLDGDFVQFGRELGKQQKRPF